MSERIIYVSRAAPGISARDTYDIVRVSHNRNRQFGLTGALILLDGWFLQVLEGDTRSLGLRFAAISADIRHCELEVRQHVVTQRPAFPDEWMAFRSGTEIATATKEALGYMAGFPAHSFLCPGVLPAADRKPGRDHHLIRRRDAPSRRRPHCAHREVGWTPQACASPSRGLNDRPGRSCSWPLRSCW
jgi:hypothetical protein